MSWEEVECLGACANAPVTQIGKDYFEVFTKCNLKTLINRDTKKLYEKAKKNIIKNLIGFNSKIKYEMKKESKCLGIK